MTAKEAKDLSIEVWSILAEQGLVQKEELPKILFDKIKSLRGRCPLCEFFTAVPGFCPDSGGCCPLNNGYPCYYGLYSNWMRARTVEDKKSYAKQILDRIKAWDISKYAV